VNGYERHVRVLGIETSCDDTAAAVVGEDGVCSDVVYSQCVHEAYGGVVPEIAARAHQEKVGVVVQSALDKAGIDRPDAVAATAGPGLLGAVLVGMSWAKAYAYALGVPFIGVNHLEGHLLSSGLERPAPSFPFLGLVVSGGHTALYRAEAVGVYETLGETVDDAAGEAFDKVARMLGLGYPGGPPVDRMAAEGNPEAVAFPRPRCRGAPMDFSFAGLKTSVRQHVEGPVRASDEDICASFQEAVIDCLMARVRLARDQTGLVQLCLAGGVAANSRLREAVEVLRGEGMEVFVPPQSRCTDNGAMIAHAGRLRLLAGESDDWNGRVRSSWPLS
jgi:N6-L-threonylcarbamoyladenine synthase